MFSGFLIDTAANGDYIQVCLHQDLEFIGLLRRAFSFLLLASILATSSGLALALHEQIEGTHHEGQQCTVCQNLTTGAKAVVSDSTLALDSFEPARDELGVCAQQIHIVCVTPAISPRAPPLA